MPVTPHAGVWIETLHRHQRHQPMSSRPTRACGLKQANNLVIMRNNLVTPHAGVWIETRPVYRFARLADVTPHAGVWIETTSWTSASIWLRSRPTRACGLKQIPLTAHRGTLLTSRPTRACGLKPKITHVRFRYGYVTPHAGVWIETTFCGDGLSTSMSRPTRACGLKLGTHN